MPVSPEHQHLIEPQAVDLPERLPLDTQLLFSIAVSLKAIREVITGDQLPPALQSVNAYGENFAVALQEGIVRGLQGISQYR